MDSCSNSSLFLKLISNKINDFPWIEYHLPKDYQGAAAATTAFPTSALNKSVWHWLQLQHPHGSAHQPLCCLLLPVPCLNENWATWAHAMQLQSRSKRAAGRSVSSSACSSCWVQHCPQSCSAHPSSSGAGVLLLGWLWSWGTRFQNKETQHVHGMGATSLMEG